METGKKMADNFLESLSQMSRVREVESNMEDIINTQNISDIMPFVWIRAYMNREASDALSYEDPSSLS